MTNEQLVCQYYDGDDAALEKLYHKNIGLIRGMQSVVRVLREPQVSTPAVWLLCREQTMFTISALFSILQMM